jgi:hypothetical protein
MISNGRPTSGPQAAAEPAPATPVAAADPAPVMPAATADPAPATPAATADPAPATPAPPAESTLWPNRLETVAASSYEWVTRPRVRLSVIGATLLLIGGLLMANSVWTLPLVIVGALMVVIAWIGHRLEGRFAVEWGDAGTQLAFRATIKPAQHAPTISMRSRSASPQLVTAPRPETEREVIDGEAHTVEIDIAELRALITAAEATRAEGAAPEPPAPGIRIRRVAYGARSPDAGG